MKNKSFVKISLMSLLSLATLSSCVRDDKYDVPTITCENQFGEPNATITQIKALAPTPDANFISNHIIQDDLIFEGYVISSDEEGNFYKTLVLQDAVENPTAGIQIAINKTFLYGDYPLGAKVRVKAKGLSVGIDRGVVKLGLGTPTGQIQASQMSKYISGVCNGNAMEVQAIKPIELNSIEEATKEQYINTLVKIKGVQFRDADGTLTYGDAVNKINVDRTIIDKNGGSMVLRNSGFAAFTGQKIPQGSGDITMVMTQYTSGRNITWQGYVNSVKDIALTENRFVLPTTITFNDITNGQTTFPNYENQALEGSTSWAGRVYNNDGYLEVSAFRKNEKVKTIIGIPVNFDHYKKISFNVKDVFYNGEVLKVYYSTQYTAGAPINTANLVDITSNFTIGTKNTGNYSAGRWTNSGTYQIPATGNGYIFFEYSGDDTSTPKLTTTIQLDNIKLEP